MSDAHRRAAESRECHQSRSALHARVLRGDTAAFNTLAADLMRVLLRRLRAAFPAVSADIRNDAAEDALMDYGREPSRFDASKGVPIEHFLYVAAWRNVIDALRAQTARQERDRRYHREQRGRANAEPEQYLALQRHYFHNLLLSVAETARERVALSTWLDDGGTTSSLADDLGVANDSPREQREAVKRFKDKMRQRIKRSSTLTQGRAIGR